MQLRANEIVYFDLRASSAKGARVALQLCAQAIDDTGRMVEEFSQLIRFADEMNAHKLQQNRYDAATWKAEALELPWIAQGWCNFLHRHATLRVKADDGKPKMLAKLVGFDTGSSLPLLHRMLSIYDYTAPISYPVRCAQQQALWYLAERNVTLPDYKLATLCRYFGVTLPRPIVAPTGVRAIVQLSQRLSHVAERAA